MNIYLINQYEENGYDTYSDAVVVAATAQAARETHPSSDSRDWGQSYPTWCGRPEGVTAVLVGEAIPDMDAQVLCASFHAG